MRICITRSEKNAYSETFIHNQIKTFTENADVVTLYGGRYPERMEDGSLINSKLFWGLHKIVKILVGRNNFFSDYGMKKFLKENKIDVVFANYGMPASHMVAPCKALGIPLVAIFHGHDATDKKLIQQYNNYKDLFAYASQIVAVSRVMQEKLLALGANPKKLIMIPYGVKTAFFKPGQTDKKPSLLAVGRFTAKKGPLYTIRAFHRLVQQRPDATLTMVGKKDGLFEECEQLAKTLNIEESIHFTGVLTPAEIAKLMQSAMIFVQHSLTAPNGDMEGTPLGILEASAAGLPIVSTLHGGIRDAVIHGKTGYLVDEKDEIGMYEYLLDLVSHPEKAAEFGANGRKHIQENHEQDVQWGKVLEVVKNAAKPTV